MLPGTVVTPQYRMQLLNPAGGALTPRSGAPHGDPFLITTEQYPSNELYKPYMLPPTGRRGRLDIKSMHSEQGEMTVRLIDARTVGSSNATRWATAFLGDANGASQYKFATAIIEESLNNGDTWNPYFRGIVDLTEAPDVYEVGPYFELTIKDYRVQEYRKVFVGKPHRSITYAKPGYLFPIGTPVFRPGLNGAAGFDGMYGTPPIVAQARATVNGGWAFVVIRPSANGFKTYQNSFFHARQGRMLASEQLASAADPTSDSNPLATRVGKRICTNLGMLIRAQAAAPLDPFKEMLPSPQTLNGLNIQGAEAYDGADRASQLWLDSQGFVYVIGAVNLPSDHPDYFLPVNNAYYQIALYDKGAPSEKSPLYIDEVSPLTLWQDIAAGKFGYLDDDGEVIGTPIQLNSAAFSSFVYNGPNVRFEITAVEDEQAFLEKDVFVATQLSARVRNDGTIEPISTRLDPLSTPPNLPYTEVESARWIQGEEILRGVEVEHTYFMGPYELDAELKAEYEARKDKREIKLLNPDSSPTTPLVNPITFFGARAAQFSDDPIKVVARGIKPPTYAPGFDVDALDESGTQINPLERIARYLLDWFEDGSAYLHLTCRRVGTSESLRQGDFVIYDVDTIPNASSNTRGGVRLGMVMERAEEGHKVNLIILDAGPNSSPIAPSLGALALASVDGVSYPSVAVSLNPSGDFAVVEYALTDNSVSVTPTTGWVHLATLIASRTVVIRQPLDGNRLWVRARTLRTVNKALPSGWVYPSNSFISISVQPRLTNARLIFSGGAASVDWVPNSGALGVRIEWELHDEGTDPGSLDNVIDVSASDLTRLLTTYIPDGQVITVQITPYSGWNGTTVTGSAGPSARRSSAPPATGVGGSISAVYITGTGIEFSYNGNYDARSFGYRVSTVQHEFDPTGATVINSRNGRVTIPSGTLPLETGESAYITGWFYTDENGEGDISKPVLDEAGIPDAAPLDPEHPLADGQYVATLRTVTDAVSEAVAYANSLTSIFDVEGGIMGVPVEKLMALPIYDLTGLVQLLDVGAKQLKNIAFGSTVVDSAARPVNEFFKKPNSSSPDDARGINYLSGTPIENLKPAQAGADITGSNTAFDVLTGVSKAVRQFGADVTASNTASDVLTGAGKAVKEAGAEPTTGKSLSVLVDRHLDNIGDGGTWKRVKDVSGANQIVNTSMVDAIFSTVGVFDRLFAADVISQAVLTKVLIADTAVFKIAAGETLTAGDIFADNLAAFSAVLGNIVAGCLMNGPYNSATAAILLNSTGFSLPPTAVRYINLAATGSALALKFPGIEISADGTYVKFAGELLNATAHQDIYWGRMGIGDPAYGLRWAMSISSEGGIVGHYTGRSILIYSPELHILNSPSSKLSFFGHSSAVRQTAATDATDLASAITLVNNLKSILKDYYGMVG